VRRLVGVNTKWRRRARTPRACSWHSRSSVTSYFSLSVSGRGSKGVGFPRQELRVDSYRVVREVTDEAGDATTAVFALLLPPRTANAPKRRLMCAGRTRGTLVAVANARGSRRGDGDAIAAPASGRCQTSARRSSDS